MGSEGRVSQSKVEDSIGERKVGDLRAERWRIGANAWRDQGELYDRGKQGKV